MKSLKWDDLIPLRQKNTDQYVPSIQQIIQYAQFIGLQFPGDQHLLYLAKQGITASLPDQWQACQTLSGDMVYRNLITKQIQQQHPLDLIYRKKVLQIKHQPLQSYFSMEFELKNTQQLPSIQQQKGQMSQSSFSDHLNQAKIISDQSQIKTQTNNLSKIGSKSRKQQDYEISQKGKIKNKLLNNNSSYLSNQSIKHKNLLGQKVNSKESNAFQNKSKLSKLPKSLQIYNSKDQDKQAALHNSQGLYGNYVQQQFKLNIQKTHYNQFFNLDQDDILIPKMNRQNREVSSQRQRRSKRKYKSNRQTQKQSQNYSINSNKLQTLQVQLKHLQIQKQLKITLLNQLKQSNAYKMNIIKNNIKRKVKNNK